MNFTDSEVFARNTCLTCGKSPLMGEGDNENLIDIRKGMEKSLHQENQASCNVIS